MVNCPDAIYYTTMELDETNSKKGDDHHVTLYQSNLITEEHMKTFVCESFNCAILDSGATSTVAGKVWTECYVESLPEDKSKLITYHKSQNSFKFGSGSVYHSMYLMKIPANIGSEEVFIEVDVVDTDVPLLLSRNAMKKADTHIDFKNDTVTMFDTKLNVIVTESGHYALPLGSSNEILSDAEKGKARVVLHIESVPKNDKNKIAHKLHSQFSHPTADKLIKLVNSAGMGEDRELVGAIRAVTDSCQICKEYRRPPPRPVTGLSLATQFNDVVAMDLKMFKGKWILHLIDHVSRFSAASFIKSKNPREIIQKNFNIWISVFGPPQKFLSDNGGEFNNHEFQTLCESFNIKVLTTAAKAPWSNGLCERHNAVLADMLSKTWEEGQCDEGTALCWAIHAKNSLSNVHGFSPYQIAIGYTPKLPCVLFDDPPALESSTSEIVTRNLQGIASARKAFIEAESSEKIRRALRHNMKAGNRKFYTGDTVYYKRNDSRKWKGPGKVIGQDSQQVLIKHGGMYVRVHPCRVMHWKESHFQRSSINKNENSLTPEASHQTSASIINEQSKIIVDNANSSSDESNSSTSSNHSQNDNRSSDNEVPQTAESVQSQSPESVDAPSTAQLTEKTTLKKGLEIEYKPENSSSWRKAKLHSRAGKATGKYGTHWNLVDGNSLIELNMNEVEWRSPSHNSDSSDDSEYVDTEHEEVHLSEVFVSTVDEQTLSAKTKELESWKMEEVYEEVEDSGQETISVRWVITPKIDNGVISTKARLVARGFEEDKSGLRTDSPTCMKETLKTVLAVAVSKDWEVHSIDIKSAFLQGNPINRKIYLRPPKEANAEGKLWLLKKVVYGLSDASRVWYLRVVEELSNLGATISKYDRSLFTWKNNNSLHGMLVVHVDDFLWCGSQEFYNEVILKLKSIFKISKEKDGIFKYIGIELVQKCDSIVLGQKSYTESIKEITLPKRTPMKHERVQDPKLHRSFRGLVGQLSWASGMTRPDAAFNSCILSTAQASPTYADIAEANKAVRDVKNKSFALRYPKLDLLSLKIVIFSDASYGNLRNGGSQGGHIVLLCDDKGNCSPISWSSKKLKRVVRSTLGAETLAAVDAIDSAYLMSEILKEILSFRKEEKICMELYTDNKSLYDALHTSNLVSDKRLRVDMSALRELSDNGQVQFRWIESKNQLADVLTKKGASKMELLRVLENARVSV